jgi:hypothetical protein
MSVNGTFTGTQNINYSTDYNLKQLNLITSMAGNGTVNLMPFLLELNLFEDIYSSTISGEVVISDAMGLISSFLLNGTEFIQVQLSKTQADTQFISRNYRVYKISKRVASDSGNYENYVINFCSEEFLLSEQYRISKTFKGTSISDIIKNILNNYVMVGNGKTKKISIESTKGVYDFVLPNKKIFETINWLSTYARPSSNNPGADMLFFENGLGYFFNSLQTLYSQPIYQTYKYDPINLPNTDPNTQGVNLQQQVTNAMDFEVLNLFDTLSEISNGAYANEVITIDPLLRKSNITIFNYDTYFNSAKTLNKYSVINNYKNRLGQPLYNPLPTTHTGLSVGALRMAVTNSLEKKSTYLSQKPDAVANDIYIEEYLPNRVSQLSLANHTRIKITVPGDPQLCAGITVGFKSFAVNPATYADGKDEANRPYDAVFTGNYLITAVRHIVKNSTYITVIEMAKDSLNNPLPAYNSSTQSNYTNGVQI